MRRRLAGAALVEKDDAVAGRIMEARHGRVGAGAGTAMDEKDGLTGAVATLGDVNLVDRRYLQPMDGIRLDRREEESAFFAHAGDLASPHRPAQAPPASSTGSRRGRRLASRIASGPGLGGR